MKSGILILSLSFLASAQTPLPRRVQAVGTASLSITPDQVRITTGVVTSASTAQEAASENATQVAKVIAAVTQTIGTKGSLKTISYSVTPNYRTSAGQTVPQLIGFTATNTIEVRVNDINLAGPVIDAAVGAGANSVGGPAFTLQDP